MIAEGKYLFFNSRKVNQLTGAAEGCVELFQKFDLVFFGSINTLT